MCRVGDGGARGEGRALAAAAAALRSASALAFAAAAAAALRAASSFAAAAAFRSASACGAASRCVRVAMGPQLSEARILRLASCGCLGRSTLRLTKMRMVSWPLCLPAACGRSFALSSN